MATILNLCLEAIEFEHTHQKIKAARKYWLTALHNDVKDMLKIINSNDSFCTELLQYFEYFNLF